MSEISQDSLILDVPTRVSDYDRVNSSLIVAIVFGGVILALLILAWVFQTEPRQASLGPSPFPLPPVDPIEPDPNQVNLFDQTTADSQPLEQAIDQVGNVVAELSLTTGWGGEGFGDGFNGTGIDPRAINDSARSYTWSVTHTAADLDEYQRKLDFFDIQIGVVHKTRNDIWRISDLSSKKTITNSNRSAESSSHRFLNRNNRLRRWDIQIAKDAGFDASESLVVHFYPPELVERMRELLAKHCGDRIDELTHVDFRVAQGRDGFRFEVAGVKFDAAAE